MAPYIKQKLMMDQAYENKSWVRKGAWTREEDELLRHSMKTHGEGNWHQVPSKAGLNRCRKSCRLRWLNYLKPDIKRDDFTEDETDLIVRLHKLLGNRWSLIAGRLPGRTGNHVKNYWNSRRRLDSLMKDKSPEATKTMIIRPRPRTFSKSSYFLNNKVTILEPSQFAENCGRSSHTSPTGENEIDWPKILLDDRDSNTVERRMTSDYCCLGLEEDFFTNFWVEDMVQSTRTCLTFTEGESSSMDFCFNVELWNHSNE